MTCAHFRHTSALRKSRKQGCSWANRNKARYPAKSGWWRMFLPSHSPTEVCAPTTYRFAASTIRPRVVAEQRSFLFTLWKKLGVDKDVVFVLHDWGSLLGFDCTRQHPDRVQGIAYMKALVQP